jgi:hypothetical protein
VQCTGSCLLSVNSEHSRNKPRKKKDRLAAVSPNTIKSLDYTAAFFLFLRQLKSPNKPLPLAKRGSAAGIGVAATSLSSVKANSILLGGFYVLEFPLRGTRGTTTGWRTPQRP